MTAPRLSPDPIVLVDVDDLAEADLEAHLAERLEPGGRGLLRRDGAGAPAQEVQRVLTGTGARPAGPADAVSLAWAIRRGGAAAASVHDLGLKAAMLAG